MVMERIRTPTESSTSFTIKWLKTVDVRFDETNGSQREHLPNVLDEVPSSETIKLMELEKSYRLKLSLKRNLSFLQLINLKTMLSLKTIPQMMILISKSKIFVPLILVLQMKFRLRR